MADGMCSVGGCSALLGRKAPAFPEMPFPSAALAGPQGHWVTCDGSRVVGGGSCLRAELLLVLQPSQCHLSEDDQCEPPWEGLQLTAPQFWGFGSPGWSELQPRRAVLSPGVPGEWQMGWGSSSPMG